MFQYSLYHPLQVYLIACQEVSTDTGIKYINISSSLLFSNESSGVFFSPGLLKEEINMPTK